MMHNRIIRLLKNVLIVSFLILLTMISFEKEKCRAQNAREYKSVELDAEIISHTAPATVRQKEICQIYITVKNRGETVWSDEDKIALCVWQDDVDWGFRARILDGMKIQKGESYTFLLEGFSISDKERTKLEFQMVKEEVTYFGEREAVEIVAVE